MAQKSRKTSSRRKNAHAEAPAGHPARDHVITFRISTEEARLIQAAAQRVPLARYSRDAVLARAAADAKK